jgi:hypothetical protein
MVNPPLRKVEPKLFTTFPPFPPLRKVEPKLFTTFPPFPPLRKVEPNLDLHLKIIYIYNIHILYIYERSTSCARRSIMDKTSRI